LSTLCARTQISTVATKVSLIISYSGEKHASVVFRKPSKPAMEDEFGALWVKPLAEDKSGARARRTVVPRGIICYLQGGETESRQTIEIRRHWLRDYSP
jgi:hypothetical protein